MELRFSLDLVYFQPQFDWRRQRSVVPGIVMGYGQRIADLDAVSITPTRHRSATVCHSAQQPLFRLSVAELLLRS